MLVGVDCEKNLGTFTNLVDMDLPPHIFGEENGGVEYVEKEILNILRFSSSHGELVKRESSTVEEDEDGMRDEMPFLQMLEAVESQPFLSIPQPSSFQLMLKLQQQQIQSQSNQIPAVEPPQLGGVNSESKPTPQAKPREKRKRKRTNTGINKEEETENQRMTHIAVERNRRRLMNDHLNALRSLMPPSYVQRGDQASIIGGAIDFVKELEQLLETLEAQKRLKTGCGDTVLREDSISGDFTVESKSPSADVQVTVIQNHANLKIQCMRRPCQLLNAILAFENLKLTVLHLNVTSSDDSLVHYSFSLKVEEDCNIGRSAAEIAGAVHQIFSIINGNGNNTDNTVRGSQSL